MKKQLRLPKQEEVTEYNLGDMKASLIELTDENRQAVAEMALSMYLGEKCKYCLREFFTLDDLKDAVYAGYHEHGRVACKSCWQSNNAS